MTTQTTHLNLWRPQIGGEEDNWGNLLNENADILDDEIAARLIADNNLSDLQSAQAARTNLGLGSAAVQSDTRYNHRDQNLNDVPNKPLARQNIGAHDASNLTTGTLPSGRLPSVVFDAGALTTGTLPAARLPQDSFVDIAVTSGDFTSGQIRVSKIGRLVTMSWTNLAHSSAVQANTANNYLPSQYRPLDGMQNVYLMNSGGAYLVTVTSTGRIEFRYRNWSGGTTTNSGTGSGTISWSTPS